MLLTGALMRPMPEGRGTDNQVTPDSWTVRKEPQPRSSPVMDASRAIGPQCGINRLMGDPATQPAYPALLLRGRTAAACSDIAPARHTQPLLTHHQGCSRARSVPPVSSHPSSSAMSSPVRLKSNTRPFSSIRSR